MTIKFRNRYNSVGKKEEFFKKYDAEDLTDQSQVASASITEMAKRFGIDAIISKAQKDIVDNQAILDQLYGHDYTKMFNSREEILNTKRKLSNVFLNIPAKIRKEVFGDDVVNFVNAYTTNNEKQLEQLNKIGLVSESQLEQVKAYNAGIKAEKQEQAMREKFVNAMSKIEGNLYENFKQTGNININNNKDNASSNPSV